MEGGGRQRIIERGSEKEGKGNPEGERSREWVGSKNTSVGDMIDEVIHIKGTWQ